MIDPKIHEIINTIEEENYRYISLDFFDTVVIRKCKEPTDLFLDLSIALKRKGLRIFKEFNCEQNVVNHIKVLNPTLEQYRPS